MSLPVGTLLPSFSGATEWLNGNVESEDCQSQSTLVQFWAVSCPVCKMNMPHLLNFTREYAVYNLRLVSIHMPRMEADMDIAKVKAAMEKMELTGPCAIDNDHALGGNFEVKAWPSYFLFDVEGRLRSRAAGALGLKMAENSLKRMLGVEEKEGIAA